MQAALQSEDILHEIFDYLVPPLIFSGYHVKECEPDRKAQEVLYNAARACKAFSEPALKQLWMHVPTLEALLGLLPSSVKVVSATAASDKDKGKSVWVCSPFDAVISYF